MRIGIIAVGRSGGYNLGEWIAAELRYQFNHEPYWNSIDTIGDRSVTKYNIYEITQGNIKPEFDKTIGLWRKDLRECVISHTWAVENGEWRKPYIITNEWIEERETKIQKSISELNECMTHLNEIPSIECWVTYEGIYNRAPSKYNRGEDIPRLLEYLDIKEPKYLHLLNPKLRLRDMGDKPKRELI